jgi:hypothetical protein
MNVFNFGVYVILDSLIEEFVTSLVSRHNRN